MDANQSLGGKERQLIRRFKDSYYDSQASQTQDDSETMLGVGEEGEIQLLKLVEELSEGISSGKAEVTLSHASYEVSLLNLMFSI